MIESDCGESLAAGACALEVADYTAADFSTGEGNRDGGASL